MTELFKLITGMYDPICNVFLIFISLNYQKTPLGLKATNTNLINITVIMTFTYTNRVIPTWNSLSDYVVSAETVNTFKRRSDKFWSDQDVLYNYRADLHGRGNSRTIV